MRGALSYDPLADTSGLVSTIVFGPNVSRRLGRVLGINILPPGKGMCTYACAYCPLAHVLELVGPAEVAGAPWPSPEQVASALSSVLPELADAFALDALVLIGNGEPTLHPELKAVLARLAEARDAHGPGCRLAVFTNSSTLADGRVVEALSRADYVVAKLDAVDEELWRAINRPHGSLPGLKNILSGLAGLARGLDASGGELVISITLLRLAGSGLTNAGERHLRALAAFLSRLTPRQVHLELPLPSPGCRAEPVGKRELLTAAELLADELGRNRVFILAGSTLPIPARLLIGAREALLEEAPGARPSETAILLLTEGRGAKTRLRILEALSGKHMNCHQVARAVGLSWWSAQRHLERLLAAGLIRAVEVGRRTYYALTPAGAAALRAVKKGGERPPARLL